MPIHGPRGDPAKLALLRRPEARHGRAADRRVEARLGHPPRLGGRHVGATQSVLTHATQPEGGGDMPDIV